MTVDHNQMKEELDKKLKCQDKKQNKTEDNTLVNKEVLAAVQTENHKSVKNNSCEVTHSVPDPKVDTQKPHEHQNQQSKESKACGLKKQEKLVDQNKQCNTNVKATDQMNKEPAKAIKRESSGDMVNGAVKGGGKTAENSQMIAEVSRHQSLHVSRAEAKGESQETVSRPSVTPLPLGQLTPPVIKLAPLDVTDTGSCDEVQSMEIR